MVLPCRYEREFGRGHRSVLKKVLEQDEPPQRPMVLCLAEILQPRPPTGAPPATVTTSLNGMAISEYASQAVMQDAWSVSFLHV